MGLQVRVRHALGERLVDLADRPVEHPLIIGRSREADVKIPSVTVANEHLALFVHNRQWVLQDTSGGATLVNGSRLDGPTPLCVGDVIILGTDANPARIEIDPAGVAQGRSGHPAETHDAAPLVSRAPATAPAAAPAVPRPAMAPQAAMAPAAGYYNSAPPTSAYGAPAPPAPAPAAPSQDAWGAQPAQDDPFAAWGGAPDSTTAAPVRRARKASRSSDSGMIIGVAVCLLIVGGTAWVLYNRFHPEPIVVVDKKKAKVIVKDDSDNIFGIGHGNSGKRAPDELPAAAPAESPRPTPTAAPAPTPAPSPVPTHTAAPTPAADPPPSKSTSTPPPEASSSAPPDKAPPADAPSHKDEAAWKQVTDAFLVSDAGQAILKADDYMRQHPGESTKDLDGLIDDSLDRLWWKRVSQLCTQQNGVLDEIKKKDKDIREETSSAFKKTLEEEKKPLNDKLAEVQRHLNGEMGYTATDPPAMDNAEVMTKLKADRDKDKFAAWKQSTLRYIRRNHGSMPWDG